MPNHTKAGALPPTQPTQPELDEALREQRQELANYQRFCAEWREKEAEITRQNQRQPDETVAGHAARLASYTRPLSEQEERARRRERDRDKLARADQAFRDSFARPNETLPEYQARRERAERGRARALRCTAPTPAEREAQRRARIIVRREARRALMPRLRAAKRPPGVNGAEPAGSAARIRRQSPAEKRGPPPPDPLIDAVAQTLSALTVLHTQLIAARAAPAEDNWIDQRQNLIPPRCLTRLCRQLVARGDPRGAIRGRTHYVRRSALDEYMLGVPRAAPSEPPSGVRALSPGEQLERELAGIPTDPEIWIERAIMARPMSRRER